MTELTTCVLVVSACDRPTSASLAESSFDSKMLALFRLHARQHQVSERLVSEHDVSRAAGMLMPGKLARLVQGCAKASQQL